MTEGRLARGETDTCLKKVPQHRFDLCLTEKALDCSATLYNYFVMERIGYITSAPNLDAVFAALADPTRRAILTRLASGEASVGELAAPFDISQPAVSKHLKILERAGLVERGIDKTRRPARLNPEPMAEAVRWLEAFREFWSSSFDQLDDLLQSMKNSEEGNTK
ncbi:ArsR/SmtB family transcription factor [Altererythrobacter sp.]|uniref:ArsR/SmtB family transcription factor n=1 Tax=Altererythrobacter sp. TaxID=1872480 RepID=UPI003D0BC2A6